MAGRPDRTRSNAQLNQKGEVNWKLWALGIGVLLFLIVVLQNSQSVRFNLLFISTDAPLILLLAVSALVGAIIGYLAPIMRRHRVTSRKEMKKLEKD